MSEMNLCRGCGANVGTGAPQAMRCGQCPPWECEICGVVTDMASLCACWVSFDGMSLADMKAAMADLGFSLEVGSR